MATTPSAPTPTIQFSSGDTMGGQLQNYGLTPATTPQGGTAYKDANGNLYLKGLTNFYLAPSTLPGTSTALPAVNTNTSTDMNGNPTVAPTPVGGQNTATPVATATPSPQVQVQPTMPSSVKTALETTANAEGNAISSTPSVPVNPSSATTPPAVDYTLHQGETIDQYNARVAQEQQAAGITSSGSSSSSSSGSSGSTTTAPNINDFLGSVPAQPTPIDSNAAQTAEGNALGIPAIQTNIQNLTTQLQQAQAQALSQEGAEASKPGVVASIINGRIKMISAEDAVAITNLNNQIKDATTQLTQANTAVNAYMKNLGTDYSNAEKAYTDAYSKALTQYNDAVSQQDKQQTSAKANAQVIINSYKGSTAGVNSITPDEIAQWNTLEQQAGLPAGTIQAAVENEMNITKFIKGSDGYTYVTGIDANGNPYTAKVEGSYGSGTGTGSSTGKTATKSDISGMSSQLDSVKGTDGYISPSDWQTAMNAWTNAGYSAASFITNFKNYANPSNVYTGLAGNKKVAGSSASTAPLNTSSTTP